MTKAEPKCPDCKQPMKLVKLGHNQRVLYRTNLRRAWICKSIDCDCYTVLPVKE